MEDVSVVTYRLVNVSIFFSGPLHSNMRLVWNELMERNEFSDEKCIPVFSLSY